MGTYLRWLARPSMFCSFSRLPTFARRHVSYDPTAALVPEARFNIQQPDGIGPETETVHDEASPASVRNEVGLVESSSIQIKSVHEEKAYKALWLQFNVNPVLRAGKRIIDRSESKTDMKLWIELLQHTSRTDGFPGVVALWNGIKAREIDLPVSGEDADKVWPALVNACLIKPPTHGSEAEAHDLLRELLEYARELFERHGVQYPTLHHLIVGGFFRLCLGWCALLWHKRFVDALGTSHIDLRLLVPDVLGMLRTARTLKQEWQFSLKQTQYFRRIYKSFPQRDLYDCLILNALENKDPTRIVLGWHQFLISHGDAPSQSVFAMEQVQRLFDLDENQSLPMVHNKGSHPQQVAPVDKAQLPRLTRSTMSTLVGDVHGIKQKEVGDTFVAKLFATQAFPLEMVIKGLSFFGIENLGPLALRELVVKSETFGDFCQKFEQVKGMKIAVDGSVYGRVLEKLVVLQASKLFDSLAASDQHPETFEDVPVQEALLASFLESGSVQQAHLSLLILSAISSEQHTSAWNSVLQHYIRNRDVVVIHGLFHQIQIAKIPLVAETIDCMWEHLLPPRTPGHAPQKPDGDIRDLRPIQFFIHAWMYAVDHCLLISPYRWREIIKRLGMMQRWNELERLILWILATYAPDAVQRKPKRFRKNSAYFCRSLFTHQMCEAFVTWSFNAAAYQRLLRTDSNPRYRQLHPETELPVNDHCEPWARGILLLRRLKEHGLARAADRARRALLQRLWIIFGPAYSVVQHNRDAKKNNRLPLVHYLEHANEIWGSKLFHIDKSLLKGDAASSAKLMALVFGVERRTSKKRRERADVVSYARTVAGHHRSAAYYTIHLTFRSQHERAWASSLYRLSAKKPGIAHYEPIDGHYPVVPLSHRTPDLVDRPNLQEDDNKSTTTPVTMAGDQSEQNIRYNLLIP